MFKGKSIYTVVLTAFAVILLLFSGNIRTHAAATATLQSALIQGSQVVVSGACSVTSEDGILHLYAQETYMTGAQGVEVAQAPNGTAIFTFPLNKNTANSNLFKKFTIVAIKNGVPTAVSNSVYITNPEAAAGHTTPRRDGGIKGMLPAAQLLNANNLKDLGVKQVTYNLLLGRITNGGGINYQYNGKTYSFNSSYVAEYDIVAKRMNAQGIQVTFIILNDLGADQTLIHPLSRGAAANYYALNAADQAGVEKLEAVASFLGQRYSNTGNGTVDNWIVGNEVNARNPWNFMNTGNINQYAAEYANAFRILYNGIKSENGNAQVYVATDQQWAVASGPSYFGSRPFLVAFNDYVKAQGNIDWRLSSHPYNVPLYDPNNWTPTRYATHAQNSRYVTMQNIDVITDFLSQPELLSPTGAVRTVKLSEVGYTSSVGEEQQAIAVTYAFLQAMSNKYVDGLIISRELDDASEIAQGLAVGVLAPDGRHKLAYEYYKHAGDPNYLAQASALAGVDLTSRITLR